MNALSAQTIDLAVALRGLVSLPSFAVENLCLDSRNVRPGDAFIAVAGRTSHGLSHAGLAVERGAIAQPGKALMVLAPDGDTQLVLQIDERNLGLIALGQPAVASADAFPERRFDARVNYINPGVDLSRASVEVKLTVPDPPAYLRQDMTVSVDIEVARRANTLVLPTRSLHDGLSNAPWIMGVAEGRARKTPVRAGLRGVTDVEILEGAKEGDQVIPATSGVLTSQRVRPVAP